MINSLILQIVIAFHSGFCLCTVGACAHTLMMMKQSCSVGRIESHNRLGYYEGCRRENYALALSTRFLRLSDAHLTVTVCEVCYVGTYDGLLLGAVCLWGAREPIRYV